MNTINPNSAVGIILDPKNVEAVKPLLDKFEDDVEATAKDTGTAVRNLTLSVWMTLGRALVEAGANPAALLAVFMASNNLMPVGGEDEPDATKPTLH